MRGDAHYHPHLFDPAFGDTDMATSPSARCGQHEFSPSRTPLLSGYPWTVREPSAAGPPNRMPKSRNQHPLRLPSRRNPSRQIASEAARAAWATTRRSPCQYHRCGRPATLITSGRLRAGFPVALNRYGRRRHSRPRVGGPARSSRRGAPAGPYPRPAPRQARRRDGIPASAGPACGGRTV
jgi:hypothetical protein